MDCLLVDNSYVSFLSFDKIIQSDKIIKIYCINFELISSILLLFIGKLLFTNKLIFNF